MRDVCVRTELCTCCLCWDRTANVLMVRVQNYERVVCAVTGAANAYTKRGIENQFYGTQMFVQARNNKYKYNKRTKTVLKAHFIVKWALLLTTCMCFVPHEIEDNTLRAQKLTV